MLSLFQQPTRATQPLIDTYAVYNYTVYNYAVYNYAVYNYTVYIYTVYNYTVYNYSGDSGVESIGLRETASASPTASELVTVAVFLNVTPG